jgi:hypothetical protein
MTPASWLLWWSALISDPTQADKVNHWSLTEERIMSCYWVNDNWYQYIRPIDEPPDLTFTFDSKAPNLCTEANACHVTDEVLGYYNGL